MEYCCLIIDSNPDCYINAESKEYMMYLYKIIIYISFLMIIKNKYNMSTITDFFNIYTPYKKYIADSISSFSDSLFLNFLTYITSMPQSKLQKKMLNRFMDLFDLLNIYDATDSLLNKKQIILSFIILPHSITFEEITETDNQLYKRFISTRTYLCKPIFDFATFF